MTMLGYWISPSWGPGRGRCCVGQRASPRDSPSCRSSDPRESCHWTQTLPRMTPQLQSDQSRTQWELEWTIWRTKWVWEWNLWSTCRVDTSVLRNKMRWFSCPWELHQLPPPPHPSSAVVDLPVSPSQQCLELIVREKRSVWTNIMLQLDPACYPALRSCQREEKAQQGRKCWNVFHWDQRLDYYMC